MLRHDVVFLHEQGSWGLNGKKDVNTKPQKTCSSSPSATARSYRLQADCEFTNEALSQLCLFSTWKKTTTCQNDLHLLPKEIDEQVALLHLPVLGAMPFLPRLKPMIQVSRLKALSK